VFVIVAGAKAKIFTDGVGAAAELFTICRR
jgi:hypothetical protein